ncbi:hypothetical protein OsI_27786 [Oryza sativa Indica Group]|uniref:Uncharacterized protein n=1 Tax=Oryza sativa subsp. indica TaxID=39946 RepID=B8BAN3_ORYSI|nr:hypothetical protein OsI_27786 [Oryza sativa Indica Group]
MAPYDGRRPEAGASRDGGRRQGLRATAAGDRGFPRRRPTAGASRDCGRQRQELLATAADGGGFARRWPGEGLPTTAADGNDTDGGGFGLWLRAALAEHGTSQEIRLVILERCYASSSGDQNWSPDSG